MKKTFGTLILLLCFIYSNAQKDTTIISLGKQKLIIIQNNDNKEKSHKEKSHKEKSHKEKLEKGKAEFKEMLKELEKQRINNEKEIDSLKNIMQNATDEEILQDLQKSLQKQEEAVENLEKQKKALEKGIKDIDDALEASDDDFEKFDWDDEDNQEDEEDYSDFEHYFNWGAKKTKRFYGHWAAVEMGLNNWINSDYKFTLDPYQDFELIPEKSWAISLNFIQFNIPFGKYNGLVTGMGSTWNHYHLRNNVNLIENTNGVITTEPETNYDLNKNNLNLWYLNVPLLYEFQIPVGENNYSIHFSFGVVGSLKLMAKYVQEADNFKRKDKSDFQIPGFKYGATFRMGYRYINLFANYDFTPLFKENRGPEIFPVSVGLVLLEF